MDYGKGVRSADDGLELRRKKSAIRRKAIKFTKVVSLVGIRHATDGRNSGSRRFVWVAWLVLGFAFATYQILERLDYYYGWPSITEFQMVSNKSLLLPQITICNDNEIVTNKSKEYGFYDLYNKLNVTLNKRDEAEKKNDTNALVEAETELKQVLEKMHDFSRNWKELSRNLTLSANESIITVTFNDGENNRSLIEEVITDRGHCFAFSTKGNPLISTKSGSGGGLFLVLSVARKEYDHSHGFEPGYRMLIHDSGEVPRMNEGGTPLKPGVVTRVAVSLEDVTQLSTPYGNCDNTVPENNEANCLVKWEYDLFLKQCSCKPMYMDQPVPWSTNASYAEEFPLCSYANLFNCTIVNMKDFLATEIAEPNCSRQCHNSNYKEYATTSAYPMIIYEPSTNVEVQADSQILDRIRVHVFYEELTFMQVKNEAEYLFFELLCDIGGALSLLLGATLLTVYEAGEFMLLFARDYLHLRLGK